MCPWIGAYAYNERVRLYVLHGLVVKPLYPQRISGV
jgi:hypothetical protein